MMKDIVDAERAKFEAEWASLRACARVLKFSRRARHKADVMAEIFKKLPPDTIVLSMFEEYQTDRFAIAIASSRFTPVGDHVVTPEIEVHISREDDGQLYINFREPLGEWLKSI